MIVVVVCALCGEVQNDLNKRLLPLQGESSWHAKLASWQVRSSLRNKVVTCLSRHLLFQCHIISMRFPCSDVLYRQIFTPFKLSTTRYKDGVTNCVSLCLLPPYLPLFTAGLTILCTRRQPLSLLPQNLSLDVHNQMLYPLLP